MSSFLLLPLERASSSSRSGFPENEQLLSDVRLSDERSTELDRLAQKSESGEQFAEEEKVILTRWRMGLPVSELEAQVVASRVLSERYLGSKSLTPDAEALLNEFQSYRRAAGLFIEDERISLKKERAAQQRASRTANTLAPQAPPANDNCSGAIGITDTGSYPITTVTVDATDATTTGDPTFCAPPIGTDRTIWYTFVPAVTATYDISSCTAGTGASSDTVVGVFTSAGSCAGPFTSIACNDDDLECGNDLASTVSPILTAGVTYYVVAGRSNIFTPADPGPIQIAISRVTVPANDSCSVPQSLTLNSPVAGTTIGANKNYQLSGSACFSGVGQSAVVADGRDVVYSFTPSATGDYSFRVTDLSNTNSDLALYVMSTCPGSGTLSCDPSNGPAIAAANRSFGSTAEEVMCVPLSGGQTYYLVVDEQQQSDGSTFTVEVNQCQREVEPNDTPGTAGVGNEGSISTVSDVDFYQLGAPAAGTRVFALLDGVAANSSDFDMRVTTATDTLEYDDREADSQFGSQAPVIAGTTLTGVASYLRINHKSGALAAEPYRIYSQLQAAGATPLAACPSITTSATAETEGNNTAASANVLPNNCQGGKTCYYASGSVGSGDADYFSFSALAGELIFLAVDGNPCRDGVVSAFNPALELRDGADAQLIRVNDTNSGLTCPSGTSICAPQSGLTATAPNSAAEGLAYRARSTGTYYARVSQGAASTGNYLLSISLGNDSVATPTPTPTPTPSPLTISGQVTDGGIGVPGVTMTFTLNTLGVIETRTTVTDASGNYASGDLGCPNSGKVEPSKTGLKFSPTSVIFINSCTAQTANFVVVPPVVISQIYASGGEAGATYRNDFIELFNRGSASVNLTGWSVQHSAGTGTTWEQTNLTAVTLQPGQRYLIQGASAGSNGLVLPTPNVGGGISMSSTAGKVALVRSTTPIPTGPCPATANVVDFVGYGATANCFDGSGPAPAPGLTTAVLRNSDGCVDTDNNSADFALAAPNPRNTSSPLNSCSSTVQFAAATASATETLNATTKVDLTVTRSGDTSGAATVNYASADGTASERSDYLTALGTLRFAAGETSKTITAFIVDDAYGESAENFTVTLSNATGVAVGATATVTVTINSNESVNGLNPVIDPSFSSDFFVRQHYIDFFNREADPGGLAFWKNQIDECVTQECREVRRINVSAAFFVSIEFQETGYLVYKANQAAFNSGEFLKLREFLPDLQEIGRGVVIGQPGAEAQLEANKQKFFLEFVQRAKFLDAAAYPTTLTAAQFVDKLNANTFDPQNPGGGALTQGERDALVAQLSANPTAPSLRAQVLRSVSENALFTSRQFNKAFVLMQYFGYLRRNPNDPPELNLDFGGYNFWLGKLNQFNGNFVTSEMVKAFITSGEYKVRFGPDN